MKVRGITEKIKQHLYSGYKVKLKNLKKMKSHMNLLDDFYAQNCAGME